MSHKVFDIVNQHVEKALKNGTVPWRKPWKPGVNAPMSIAGYAYHGINFFLLSMLPFASNVYLTFNQIKKHGGRIKKGEEKNHHPIFFWLPLKAKDDRAGNPLPDGEERKILMFRYTRVWNFEQVEGVTLPKRFTAERPTVDPIEACEDIVKNYKDGPTIVIKDTDRACYYPALDRVHNPKIEQFSKREEYYSTLFHELAHSTGHKSRLNRKELMDGNYFGSHDYSIEELVAEMGAAYICAHVGISNATLDNSAAYISGWLDKVKRDPKLFATAASRAEKAFQRIVGKVEEAEETEELAEAA